jgi:hypothetical protein
MKTIRLYKPNIKIAAFTNGFVTYGKVNNTYSLEIELYKKVIIPFYKSNKRPIVRNIYLLTSLFAFILPIIWFLLSLSFLVYYYINGAKNFIIDSAWVDGVRFFTWTNMFIILILTIILILK